MKRLPSINLSRIYFRSFLLSCSMFFACANTHATGLGLSKLLTMGLLLVASQTQGNNHPEVSLGLTDPNNSPQINSYDNGVMNSSNLTNSYTTLTVYNNETFSPSTLRLIDPEGNSAQCSFESNDHYKADIRCIYGELKRQNLSLVTCDDKGCVILPMPYKADELGFEDWLALGTVTVVLPAIVILAILCPNLREEREKKERERVKGLEVNLKKYEQRMGLINKLCHG